MVKPPSWLHRLQIREFIRFWWRCAVWAFSGLWKIGGLAGKVGQIVVIVASLIGIGRLVASNTVNRLPDLLGDYAPWIIGVLLLVIAPYVQWRREKQRADSEKARADEATIPKIRCSIHPRISEDHKDAALLKVHAPQGRDLVDCQGKVLGLPDGRDWTLCWSRAGGQWKSETKKTIHAGDSADLCLFESLDEHIEVVTHPLYLESPVDRPTFLPDQLDTFRVRISASNTAALEEGFWLEILEKGSTGVVKKPCRFTVAKVGHDVNDA